MNKTNNELFYYLGRDEAHNYVATPISNMIIAGHTGAGKTVFLNNVLIRIMQECNPSGIKMQLIDCKGYEYDWWKEAIPENKELPYFSQIDICKPEYAPYCVNGALDGLVTLIQDRKDAVDYNMGNVSFDSVVLIVDEYQCAMIEDEKIAEGIKHKLEYILKHSEDVNVYVIFCSQSHLNTLPEDIVKLFTTRVCTRLAKDCEDISNLYLGNNCAAMEEITTGVVWVKYNKRLPIRFYVPFYPDTWIKKFIRTYSVYKKEDKNKHD